MTTGLELRDEDRNKTYMDWWSLTHIAWGAVLVLFLSPFWSLVVLVLWEPFEILVLSRLAAKVGIRFGHETLRNSLMDIVFGVVGVLVGLYLLTPVLETLTS